MKSFPVTPAHTSEEGLDWTPNTPSHLQLLQPPNQSKQQSTIETTFTSGIPKSPKSPRSPNLINKFNAVKTGIQFVHGLKHPVKDN
jgi:hypothetical protein